MTISASSTSSRFEARRRRRRSGRSRAGPRRAAGSGRRRPTAGRARSGPARASRRGEFSSTSTDGGQRHERRAQLVADLGREPGVALDAVLQGLGHVVERRRRARRGRGRRRPSRRVSSCPPAMASAAWPTSRSGREGPAARPEAEQAAGERRERGGAEQRDGQVVERASAVSASERPRSRRRSPAGMGTPTASYGLAVVAVDACGPACPPSTSVAQRLREGVLAELDRRSWRGPRCRRSAMTGWAPSAAGQRADAGSRCRRSGRGRCAR